MSQLIVIMEQRYNKKSPDTNRDVAPGYQQRCEDTLLLYSQVVYFQWCS